MQDHHFIDVFGEYDLPFNTYFATALEHDMDSHDDLELIWLMKGSALIHCDDQTFELTDHSIFLIYMNRSHAIHMTEGSILLSFRFFNAHLERNQLHFHDVPFTSRVYPFKELSHRYHAVPLIITQMMTLLIEANLSPATRYKIIGYYNSFTFELYNMLLKEKYLDVKTRNSDPYLLRIHLLTEYIYAHAHEKVTLAQLAEITGLSTFSLSHFIKDYLGISFSEFLQDIRFENALYYLKHTDLSIQDISKRCGFSDVKYLNQTMKDRHQATALQYRKRLKAQKKDKKTSPIMTDFLEALRLCLIDIKADSAFLDTYGLSVNMP